MEDVANLLSACQLTQVREQERTRCRMAEFEYDFGPPATPRLAAPCYLSARPTNSPTPAVVVSGWIDCDGAGTTVDERRDAAEFDAGLARALMPDPARVLARASGDFALALWDDRNAQTILATDVYATCPVYYSPAPSGALFAASDLRALLACEEVPFEVNTETCRRFISFSSAVGEDAVSDEATFVRAVRKLPAASTLRRSVATTEVRQYWGLSDLIGRPLIREDATACFRSTLHEAVARRLAGGTTAVEFSGGLDSGTVLAAALAAGPANRLHAVNLAFGDTDLADSHDLPMVRHVLRHLGVRGTVILADALLRIPNAEPGSDPLAFLDGPDPSASPLAREAMSSVMLDVHATHALTGEGGDAVLGEHAGHLVLDSLIRQRKIGQVISLLQARFRRHRVSALLHGVGLGLAPFLPGLRDVAYYRYNWAHDEVDSPDFLAPEQRLRDSEWLAAYRRRYRLSGPLTLWGHRFLYDFLWPRAGYYDAINLPFQRLHPFLDRGMLELAFRIPPEQHCDPAVLREGAYRAAKFLARKAFSDVLPEVFRTRKTKTSYALMHRKILQASSKPLLRTFCMGQPTRVADLGIVHPAKFRDHLVATLIRAEDPNNDLGITYQYTRSVIDLEIWLRETDVAKSRLLERARPTRPRALAPVQEIA